MDNFDNVAFAEEFAGKKLGQLIAKKETKSKTVWVYEGSVIRSEVKRNGKIENFAWTADGGQEMFFVLNNIKLVDTYVETVRMQLAKEYMVEAAKVWTKDFRSAAYDKEHGIVRDYSKVNAILEALGARHRCGPKN